MAQAVTGLGGGMFYAGDARPDGQQHLLDRSRRDVDGLRGVVRRGVIAGLGDDGAVQGRCRPTEVSPTDNGSVERQLCTKLRSQSVRCNLNRAVATVYDSSVEFLMCNERGRSTPFDVSL